MPRRHHTSPGHNTQENNMSDWTMTPISEMPPYSGHETTRDDARTYLARLSGQPPTDSWHKIRYCELPNLHFEVMCDINPARAYIVVDRGDWNDVTADGLEWLQKNILPYQEDWTGRPADSGDIDGIGGTVGAVCVNPEDALRVLKLLLPKEAFWLSQIRDDVLSEPVSSEVLDPPC